MSSHLWARAREQVELTESIDTLRKSLFSTSQSAIASLPESGSPTRAINMVVGVGQEGVARVSSRRTDERSAASSSARESVNHHMHSSTFGRVCLRNPLVEDPDVPRQYVMSAVDCARPVCHLSSAVWPASAPSSVSPFPSSLVDSHLPAPSSRQHGPLGATPPPARIGLVFNHPTITPTGRRSVVSSSVVHAFVHQPSSTRVELAAARQTSPPVPRSGPPAARGGHRRPCALLFSEGGQRARLPGGLRDGTAWRGRTQPDEDPGPSGQVPHGVWRQRGDGRPREPVWVSVPRRMERLVRRPTPARHGRPVSRQSTTKRKNRSTILVSRCCAHSPGACPSFPFSIVSNYRSAIWFCRPSLCVTRSAGRWQGRRTSPSPTASV